jgi:hypothetical protein
MTIEIHQPELEALIQTRLDTGVFESVEDLLIQALKSSPLPTQAQEAPRLTGADLIAAMQSSPYKEIDLEPSRPHMTVRDIAC